MNSIALRLILELAVQYLKNCILELEVLRVSRMMPDPLGGVSPLNDSRAGMNLPPFRTEEELTYRLKFLEEMYQRLHHDFRSSPEKLVEATEAAIGTFRSFEASGQEQLRMIFMNPEYPYTHEGEGPENPDWPLDWESAKLRSLQDEARECVQKVIKHLESMDQNPMAIINSEELKIGWRAGIRHAISVINQNLFWRSSS